MTRLQERIQRNARICEPTGLHGDYVRVVEDGQEHKAVVFISHCVGSQTPITLCWTLQTEHARTHYIEEKKPVSTAVLQNTIAERMT